MSNLTPDELARLRLKAKHGTLTPEEQRAYNDYVTEQLSAVSSPPLGAVPPKKDKPKRNIDAIDVVRKIAGVAVIVAALVFLGPSILRFGFGIADGMLDVRDSITESVDSIQNSPVEYYSRTTTISDLGDPTNDVSNTDDLYVCGDRMVLVESRNDVIQSIKTLEKGAHGWEYRGELSDDSLAQWLSDNGLAIGSTREQALSYIRYSYEGYEPMTGAYVPEILNDSNWVETITDSQMFVDAQPTLAVEQ